MIRVVRVGFQIVDVLSVCLFVNISTYTDMYDVCKLQSHLDRKQKTSSPKSADQRQLIPQIVYNLVQENTYLAIAAATSLRSFCRACVNVQHGA